MSLSSFFLHTVKWFHFLLSNMNNSIYYKSFVCTQLNVFKQCHLTLAIQLSISCLFTLSKMIKQFYFKQFSLAYVHCQTVLFNPWIGSYQFLPLWARVDLGVMAMKGYSTFPKAPVLLKPQHQVV